MKADLATKLPECHEGRQAAQNFNNVMVKLLSVPHSEIVRREQEYRKQVAANPNRRGPKPKRKR